MSNADRQQLLREAVESVLVPLARLCVAHGLPFAQAEEVFKRAFVRAARDAAQAGAASTRDVSQVSTATGINRREVTRISADLQPLAMQRPTPATQVYLRWVSSKRLRDADGKPRALPRSGRAPSFDSLASSVTRHVHPRSLLDELCRLKLAALSDDGQTVTLLEDRYFVPGRDEARMLGFLGANVADHLAAAVSNVVQRDRGHVEQALFTDELSAQAARELTEFVRRRWAALAEELVPEFERLIAEDKARARRADQRARVGMFSYHEVLPETDHDDDAERSE